MLRYTLYTRHERVSVKAHTVYARSRVSVKVHTVYTRT